MSLSAATPSRPKTPGSASQRSEAAAPVSASTPAQVAVVWETPRRKSTDGMSTPLERRSSTSSNKSSGSATRVTSIGKIGVGGDDSNEGLVTPALRGGSCAICLSPLRKSGRREVYTVQLCRHSFHRDCLVENRKAGNTGCPYCRGELERGLTPETTPAEREASAVAERQQDQREAIRNAAARARTALARSLRLRQEARAREAATAAGTGDSALVQSY
eukprot:g1509.t1